MPPTITQETMNLLKSHLGREVILTGTQLGKEHSRTEKLWQVIDFGVINERPLIGMNSAVIQIQDVVTGAVLMKNTKINPKVEWGGHGFMWWLRFRSYGFSVTLDEMSSIYPMARRFRNWLNGFSFCLCA